MGGLAVAGYVWLPLMPPGQAGKPAPAANAGPAPVAVEIMPVGRGAVQRELQAVGSLRSNEAVMIRPEIAGRITQILFDEGQKARKGDPLVRLDAAIAQAQLDQATASLILSRANHERAADLVRKGVGTQRAYEEALAKLRADEAALALAQATLDKTTLVAPFDGVLGLRRVSVGDYVNPGQDLVNIENIDTLKVDFRVPEIHALRLATGQSIKVVLDAIPDAAFDGKVYAIDPAHDPNGRAVILRARISNSKGHLRSGMFARVTLLIDERDDAIMIPETALVPVGDEKFVYRVVDDNAVLTKVRLGQRRGGKVEIVEGLTADAMIVTEGAMKLRDGVAVRPAASKAP
ncbi:efflux RND transporter periplasmic adaptor subunit [Vineibacter terrae]|uniref:efflux RND transporter periplasmic adaptor subunit n=1 Tax=Vineibacter terrae TaxID=2586908 RepID=UPI002E35C6FA|nr:efflux RND transporter periplasmic adaptor subunit [Vineibacter terrae]HEX2890360.1 efflux RND transporter periplasmic adaptor subunit [Vineibacter terrae]